MGRLLGVDYGDRRVGLALSDPLGMIASAREVVPVEAPEHAANQTVRRAQEWGAEGIVVGLPLNMDGTRGPAVQKVEAFVALLKERCALPIHLWDERLSTKSAHDAMRETGMREKDRRGLVDKVAAQILLQGYLDAHPTF